MSRFLITTADERTWPKDQPVLFLGEWCKLYARRHIWSKMDAEVVPYHWDDRNKFYSDHCYLRDLHERMLAEVANHLNEIHGAKHSLRYWRILIGPWLGFFIQMLFDRWEMIQGAVRTHQISGTRIADNSLVRQVPNDMVDFQRHYLGDHWNQAIYGHILDHWSDVNCERVTNHASISKTNGVSHPQDSMKQFIWRCVFGMARKVLATHVKPNEAFFIADYLPLRKSLALQVELGQIPRMWGRVPPPTMAADTGVRDWRLSDNKNSDFENALCALIPLQIPTIYLEGYGHLIRQVSLLPWPHSPRFIFTSNSHEPDDVFKAWAAQKVEAGAPLVVGQHGGHYGTGRWSFEEEHEIAISDKYLTWGWETEGTPKVVPALAIKLTGCGKGEWSPRGDALLVTCSIPRYGYFSFSAPEASQWLSYFNDQCRFVDALPDEIRRHFLVRLYAHDYGWGQVARWRERFPDLRLNDGTDAIEPLIRSSRLYISTYNATTFLETLARNIPTIMFWNPKHWELRPSAQPYFDRLQKVGIFHDTPVSAATKVTEIWDNVPGWWNKDEIQEARVHFSDRFARMPENPYCVLKEALTTVKPGVSNGRVPL